MELQDKILDLFEGKVVRKDLAIKVKGNMPVPTFVLEYLLGQNCALNDEVLIKEGVEKVKAIIQSNYVHRSDSELTKSIIRETGSHKIIDKIKVELNDKQNIYQAEFGNLALKKVPISDKIVKSYPKLLSGGGVWCILQIGFDHAADADVRWIIESLKPIQIASINLEEYINLRKEFSTEEWIDLLMHSIGLNPEFFKRRDKLIQISRLITHCENNFSFIELGPKGTGKSHVFLELSPHGVLVSGGDVSSPQLFVNKTGEKIGLVGYWDVVAWDEFEQQPGKKFDPKMIDTMQNYLANQSFNRGKGTYQATASLAFIGNTKHNVPYMLKNSHLFESIPESFIKGAFLDRIYLFIPGWEVKILKKSVFSTEFGFIVDYLAEILKELRKYDFTNLLEEYVKLDSSMTTRDQTAIRKTFSGLVKLLYPDKNITHEEALELVDFAVEGRRRVKEQLYIIDETFKNEPVKFSYVIKSTEKEVEINTLEVMNFNKTKTIIETEVNTDEKTKDSTNKKILQPKQIAIRDNQTGISYQKLFGDYVEGAKKITITDPYIRMPYQFKNLVEFCVMLLNLKSAEEEINLHVITWNSEMYIQDSIDNFEEIKENVAEMGINLTWEFQDYHDRNIIIDNGWKINLGRGLDIFEPREGRLNIGDFVQENRKCKNCEITFLKQK